ncbi:hypothetical protein Trydic_g4961 [Trypoxylus dichotomus]
MLLSNNRIEYAQNFAWGILDRVAQVKANLIKWDLALPNEDVCNCGVIRKMNHHLECTNRAAHCTIDDLWQGNPATLDVTVTESKVNAFASLNSFLLNYTGHRLSMS